MKLRSYEKWTCIISDIVHLPYDSIKTQSSPTTSYTIYLYVLYTTHKCYGQTCNSLKMARIYGRNINELCIINMKTLFNYLVVKFSRVLYLTQFGNPLSMFVMFADTSCFNFCRDVVSNNSLTRICFVLFAGKPKNYCSALWVPYSNMGKPNFRIINHWQWEAVHVSAVRYMKLQQ